MENIYLFSEIDSSIRETLGKNACEMIDTEPNSLGFVLTQEACAEFYITREIEKDLRGRITAVLDGLCSDAGVKFGESATVSIFASTVVPMPGILEKINGVGLNESVLSTLPDEAAQKAWALHLQLMKAFACEMDVSSRHFTDLENEATGKYGVDEIEKLSVEALRELCAAFKNVYAAQGVCSLSTDPYEQFFMLLKTAFRSWDNPRACVYRGMKGITDSGLSIAVQLVDLKTGKYFKNRTTIAAADRNNKEKDASNKSAPQGEFKRIEIDGDLFEGYFINGKKNGRGKYTWANGDVFDGNWVDGKRTGKGRITWSNGDTYEGEWKDGKLCGRGKLIQYGKSPSGETYMKYSYDGEWLDSKEHGHGICVEGDFGMEKMDKVFEGEWVNGKRQGRFVWYYTNSKGGRYMDFYEDGNLIETCIPYDESIKTVEDARRARALADGKSSSTTPVYTNSSPAAAQDSADTAEDFEWEEFSSVGELHEKLLRPELFRDPEDRYLLNSCMYLDTFIDEFREEFTDGDYAETKEIIAEILGVESGELTESIELRLDFIRGFTEKEYLLAAMYSLAYDERTDLAPYLANLACYLWTDTGDGDYFNPLLDLFKMSGEYDDDDSTWLCAILRMQENGNIDEPLEPNDDGSFDNQFAYFDDVFGDLLDKGYLPGSDGKMYLSDIGDDSEEEAEESDTGDDVLLRYQNGDSYRGAAIGGVREGFGAYFFADGGFYRGSFHAGNYEGYGMLDEGNGKVYKGLWKDDKRCGYGEQTYADGEVYRGWWKDNRFHGFGRYEFANGEVFVGEFFGGMRHGISLMRRSNGKWYGKRWNNDDILPSPTGPRVLNTKDGSRYVGAVTERRVGSTVYISRHGFGEVRFSDVNASDLTDCYVGQFVNDSPCGTGVCILTKGDNPYIIASDDFSSNSLPEGECRMIWLSFENGIEYAEYYVGGFYDSKWCGRGTLYLIESGEYQDARLYGLKSGTVICCNTFDHGPDGFASVTDAYGEMRYGRFVDGLWKPNK
ncbi:MAG: hypothetical protein KIG44_01140 [Eubacteriales bacterium]|nr:hypothetical protein [Eubacteriales bacterium]